MIDIGHIGETEFHTLRSLHLPISNTLCVIILYPTDFSENTKNSFTKQSGFFLNFCDLAIISEF